MIHDKHTKQYSASAERLSHYHNYHNTQHRTQNPNQTTQIDRKQEQSL